MSIIAFAGAVGIVILVGMFVPQYLKSKDKVVQNTSIMEVTQEEKLSQKKVPTKASPLEERPSEIASPDTATAPGAGGEVISELQPVLVKPGSAAKRETSLQSQTYSVCVGSYKNKRFADDLSIRLKKKGYSVTLCSINIAQGGSWIRVNVGSFPTKKEAVSFAGRLRGKEKLPTLVVEQLPK